MIKIFEYKLLDLSNQIYLSLKKEPTDMKLLMRLMSQRRLWMPSKCF